MISSGFKRWLAVGSGAGIHIEGPRGAESARIAAVRVRPNGARLLGGFTIEDLPHQPAAVWGADIAAFLRKLGLQNTAATVVLPRRDVIVRVLSLPGVAPKDLAAAVHFQMDGLHPYNDDDVVSSWTRLGGSGAVLVAIARRDLVERYATLFAEAGVRITSFTCSAAAIYSALRLFGPPKFAKAGSIQAGSAQAGREILAAEPSAQGIEVYGESLARPVFSASFPLPPRPQNISEEQTDRAEEEVDLAPAAALAAAELRLENTAAPVLLRDLLGSDPPLPFAAALASACPRLVLALNLLPVEHRRAGSKMMWIPAAAMGAVVLALAGTLVAYPILESRSYARTLAGQIAQIQPAALRAAALDREIEAVHRRTQLLDDLRRRSRADMDALGELTRLLPPPTWLNLLELNALQGTISGETDQAATLLKTIDGSPLFESSEFVQPPLRLLNGEGFRVRFRREVHP
jgi:Tfp pilus assembly protein PilN